MESLPYLSVIQTQITLKAKVFITVILLLLLSGAAYWYYVLKRPNSEIEHILPETSLFTIHGENLREGIEAIESYSWFTTVKSIPFVENLTEWSARVDSLEAEGSLQSKVTELPFWISFHSTGSDHITPLYIIEAKGFDWKRENIVKILQLITEESFNTSLQVFNGFELINVNGANARLVMMIQGKYLAISEENLLVEDVVRAVENEGSRLVDNSYNSTVSGDVQLILNNKRLGELHNVFFKEGIEGRSPGKVSLLNLNFTEDGILAQGNSTGASQTTLGESSLFGKNLIPVTSTSFEWQPVGIGLEGFATLLKPELLSISLDMNFAEVSEVVLINTADTTYLRRELNRISESKVSAQDSTVYSESYLNTDLGYIQQSDFVQQLTSDQVNMAEPYFAIFQNTLILSDNLDALKTVMNEFDNESTWGKSVELRRILDDMVQDTDLTLVKDFNYGSEALMEELKPVWVDFLGENSGLKSLLNRLLVQLNSSNNGYLVTSNLRFNEVKATAVADSRPDNTVPADLKVKANVFADTVLRTRPFVVRNHVNSNLEVIFQDANQSLYLTTRQGEILWKQPVNGSIIGPIHQVDYYNNKKLQYLFFTDSLVHLIDRNGEMVEGFPKPYSSPMTIDGSAVIDYDNSKRYRYLAKDRRGNITLFDKEVNALEGWNPLELGSELLQTPFHVRVRGRDAFVAVERTGEISLLNRRGEYYNGFPTSFDLRYKGDVSLIKGPNFAGTRLAVIGEEGKLMEVNFEGKVIQEKQLFRPTTRSEFSLVNDVLETGYSILRNDLNRIAFYNMSGETVFEIPFDNSGQLNAEFYNFRNGKELYVVRDLARNQLYLFNNRGEQICPVIPASERIGILYYQNLSEYEVFVNFANQLNIYAIDAQ